MLKQWMENHNLTNSQAAEILGFKSPSIIEKMKSGKREVTKKTKLLMAHYDREHKSPFMDAT